jgi:peptidoglycan-associated lipoprotein
MTISAQDGGNDFLREDTNMSHIAQKLWVTFLCSTIFLFAGCAKKVAKVTPPPPPAVQPQPTASLSATPSAVERGQATTLTWTTQNASTVNIDGIGVVSTSGSKKVSPADSTTYQLQAKGPGGDAEASARVTVTAPPVVQAPSLSEEELFDRNVKDVFFDYDKYAIRPDQVPVTRQNATFLQAHTDMPITIEGHCDDRGSEEYNLALGDSRANALKEQLIAQGVSAARIKTISYGKERPFCSDDNESCWSQNRRDHLLPRTNKQ